MQCEMALMNGGGACELLGGLGGNVMVFACGRVVKGLLLLLLLLGVGRGVASQGSGKGACCSSLEALGLVTLVVSSLGKDEVEAACELVGVEVSDLGLPWAWGHRGSAYIGDQVGRVAEGRVGGGVEGG